MNFSLIDTIFSHYIGVFVIVLITVYVTWHFAFWKRYGFPYAKTTSSFGGLLDFLLLRKSIAEYFADIYNEANRRNLPHIGAFFFMKPVYVPRDLVIVKHLLTKDFNNFMDRGVYYNLKDDPLSGHLFNLEGEYWRLLRHKLSPTFTSGQMKMMFPILVHCSENFCNYIRTFPSEAAIDIKEMLARLTTDIIGSCAFGIQCNSFENPDAEFRKYGKMFFDIDLVEYLRALINFTMPQKLLQILHMRVIKSAVSKFFMGIVTETVDYREKCGIYRKDFMQLLIALKNKESDAITINELAAQALVFFLAGFETSSTNMTFSLYELALNQNIQDKLRDEINTTLEKYNGQLTYEAVTEMHYIQQVIDESLRKYPPVPILHRICKNDYHIPETDFILPKGTQVEIPVFGMHYNETYFPKPHSFDPDRFSEKHKHQIPHCAFLPFGEGPRNCIGLRFGILQSKIGLISLLRNYRVTLHEKMKVPLEMDKATFILTAKDGVWVKITELAKKEQ